MNKNKPVATNNEFGVPTNIFNFIIVRNPSNIKEGTLMGEIADMMIEGALCSDCGAWTEEFLKEGEAPGYQTLCEDCEEEEE